MQYSLKFIDLSWCEAFTEHLLPDPINHLLTVCRRNKMNEMIINEPQLLFHVISMLLWIPGTSRGNKTSLSREKRAFSPLSRTKKITQNALPCITKCERHFMIREHCWIKKSLQLFPTHFTDVQNLSLFCASFRAKCLQDAWMIHGPSVNKNLKFFLWTIANMEKLRNNQEFFSPVSP